MSFQREETSVTLFAQKNGKEQLTPSFDLIVLVLECVCMPTLNLQHNLLVYDTSHTFVKTSKLTVDFFSDKIGAGKSFQKKNLTLE